MGTMDLTALQIANWENAQAQSKANSERTTGVYTDHLPPSGVYLPGEGSRGPGTFVSTGTPPNYENGAPGT